jgi:transcriptional regulator GlxA family with amidase domain
MTKRIGILVFNGFDVIDAGGPYEVFLTASRLAQRDGRAPLYDVVLISPDGQDVTAFGGLQLTGLQSVQSAGPVDVVVVPGLITIADAVGDAAVMGAVRDLAAGAAMVTSVCTGAFLLAHAGLLNDRPATTHWEDLSDLEALGATGTVVEDMRWVDDGDVVTSGGLASGIHMALHVVERLDGRELAERTAKQLEVLWDPSGAISRAR